MDRLRAEGGSAEETDIVDPMLDCFVFWPIFGWGTGQRQKGELITRSPDMCGMSHIGTFAY